MDKEYHKKEVIEGKLLASLEDGGKVAVVLNKQDCNDLILALCLAMDKITDAPAAEHLQGTALRLEETLSGLKQLKEEAFGK